MDLNWLKTAQEATQLVSSLILALFAVCSSLSLILGFLGTWWPWAKTAAPAVSRFGVTLHDLGEKIGSLFGGGHGLGARRGFAGVRLLAFVSVVGVATLIAGAVGGSAGCTPQARTVTTQVLTDVEKGCVWLEELAPAFGLPAPTVQDLEMICKIDSQASDAIIAVINDFQAHAGQVQSMVAQHDGAMKLGQPLPAVPQGAAKRKP